MNPLVSTSSLLGRQIVNFDATSDVYNYVDLTGTGSADYMIILQTPGVIGPSVDLPLSFGLGTNVGQIVHFVNNSTNVNFIITSTPTIQVTWIGNPGDIISMTWTGSYWVQLYTAGPGQNSWVDFVSASPNVTSNAQGFLVQGAAVFTRGSFDVSLSMPPGNQFCIAAPPGMRGTWAVFTQATNGGINFNATMSMSAVNGLVTVQFPNPWNGGTVQFQTSYVVTG